MASTFSPILRIELIGTGDQSGTWGNTTNVNLGTLIEQAIAGTAAIDVTSGNVTLTNFNGTTDEARCMAIRVSGTPGTSRNVIAPAVSKIYVIANGSDAAVVLKTSASTGLTVPSGEVYLAYYDPTIGTADFRLVGRASSTANTANTLVLRDGSGNFAAGTITAALTGNVTGNLTGSVVGVNVSSSGTLAVTGGLTLDGAAGTSGQVMVSAGSGNTPTWGNAFVAGMIMLWSGSSASIPSGWLLCDGSNSTPDLRNRFVVGAGSTYAVGATGGSADAIVVSHTHSVTDPGHVHDLTGTRAYNVSLNDIQMTTLAPNNTGQGSPVTSTSLQSATTGITIASAGSSGTNANLPPYYALCYIMKS